MRLVETARPLDRCPSQKPIRVNSGSPTGLGRNASRGLRRARREGTKPYAGPYKGKNPPSARTPITSPRHLGPAGSCSRRPAIPAVQAATIGSATSLPCSGSSTARGFGALPAPDKRPAYPMTLAGGTTPPTARAGLASAALPRPKAASEETRTSLPSRPKGQSGPLSSAEFLATAPLVGCRCARGNGLRQESGGILRESPWEGAILTFSPGPCR
jgi:hypothetical protein